MNTHFEDVATVYKKSASTTITKHRIEYRALGEFCVSLNSFISKLEELANEDYWRRYLSQLKHLRFCLCAAPLPKEYRFERISTIISELKYHLRFCQKMYPDLAQPAFSIIDLLRELLDNPKDPLLEKLLELTDVKQNVAWVIKESRLISPVEELVSGFNLPRLCLIHPLQLKNLTCYDRLLVIGPTRWYSESIFTAPRANQIDVLVFDWIVDTWKPQNVFANPHKSSGASSRKYITVEEHATDSRWNDISPESLLLIVDEASSVLSTLKITGDDWDEYENIDTKCIFLEDGWVVLIDASDGAKTLAIDPDEDTDNRIVRIFGKEIVPGMFILVRTSGGGDYIVPIANKIMGNQALQAREHQKHWKELLRRYAKTHGLLKTSIDLLDHGSNIANEMNVRNWMSPRSICTRKYSNFLAIMKLVGLESVAQEYWSMMKRINRAHLKAGFEIRNLLLEHVKDIDMEILQKQGKMDFKLSGDDEGGLTAFRVESVLPETLEVPYSRIGQPVKLEGQLWRE